MPKSPKNPRRPHKIFQYQELAEYYKVTPQTISNRLSGEDLKTFESVRASILLLEKRYG